MTTRQIKRAKNGATHDRLVTAAEAATILGVSAKRVRAAGYKSDGDGRKPYGPIGKNASGAHMYSLTKLREALA